MAADPTTRPRTPAAWLYLWIDVAATLLFALEGASAGIQAHLDLFGVLVVGFSTALVGGIVRDLLLGDAPPAAFRSPSRIVAAFLGGLIAFALFSASAIPASVLTTSDAAALALFAVTGAAKAREHGSNGLVVVMLGTITGVGGGVVRDLLLGKVPAVLTADIYASAAALGAFSFWLTASLKLPPVWAMAIGIVVCFGVRTAAVAFGWQLPRA